MSSEFEALFSVDDLERQAHPMRTAQASMRKPLPKRFYEKADAEPCEGGHRLVLDGKPALTPKRAFLIMPAAAASLVAREWNLQRDLIDPAGMPATRMVNAALDHVSQAMDEVRDDAARYAASDLICYRALEPQRLAAMQQHFWAPVQQYCEKRFGVPLRFASSIVHVAQDPLLLQRYRIALDAITQPIALAALHVMVTLSGSAFIALACAEGQIAPIEAFAASEVDADFETEVWGSDDEAMARRAFREAEFVAAAALYQAAAG